MQLLELVSAHRQWMTFIWLFLHSRLKKELGQGVHHGGVHLAGADLCCGAQHVGNFYLEGFNMPYISCTAQQVVYLSL